MKEQQREGIEIAKKKGVYKEGYKKKIDKNKWSIYYKAYLSRKITKNSFQLN